MYHCLYQTLYTLLIYTACLTGNRGRSAFYHTFFRVYSPVSFAQKHDKAGRYIRHYLPSLAKMPDK